MDVGTCVYFELFDQVPEKLKKLRQMGFTLFKLQGRLDIPYVFFFDFLR